MCQHAQIDTTPTVKPDGIEAWRVAVAACAANLVAFGILFSFGVFLTPLGESFNAATGPVAALFSGAVFVYYLAGVVAGRSGDRWGVRPVVLVGAFSLAAGLALAAQAGSLWQLYLTFVPLVGLGVGCCYSPMIGEVGRWFDRRRSMAIGVVLAGVGAGTLLGPIILRALVDDFGWRTTFRVLAGVCVFLIGGSALTLPRTASDVSRIAVDPISSYVRSQRFRRLYLSQILIAPGFFAPFAFYNDYSVEQGVSNGRAAALIGISGAFSVVARLVLGSVGDNVDGLLRYRLSFGLLTGSLLIWLFAGGFYPLLVLSALVHGLGWAVWVTAAPTVLADWFGVERLGGALGLFYTGLGVGALVGPAVSGFIVDRSGFRTAIAVVTVASTVSLLIALRPMDDQGSREDRDPTGNQPSHSH